MDLANTLFADGYAALGFKLGQRVGRGLSWFADGPEVITDSRAPAAGGQNARVFSPGVGRSVFAGLEWRM